MKNEVALNVDISGSGTPVLLLHGFPDSRKIWQAITPYFLEKNYQVIAPDMRGFGDSPNPNGKKHYKIKHVVADLVELLKNQNVYTPVHVVGHDWGSVIGWSLALAYPELVKSFVAVSVGHPKSYAWAGMRQKLKGLYVLGFQFTKIAEYYYSKNNYSGLRKWGYQHPSIEDAIRDMERPGD